MDQNRVNRFARWLEAGQSRRLTLGSGLAAFAMAIGSASIEAKKKRKKKRKKKKQPTCAQLCGETTCANCFYPPTGAPYCGHAYSSQCVPCETDGDCLGNPSPYCVARAADRETGEVTTLCGLNGVCTAISVCPA